MMTEALTVLGTIRTARLAIRPLIDADAAAFAAMTDDPAITEIIHFLPTPFTMDDATRLIAGEGDGRDCFFGVWRQGDDMMIGTVGTHLRGADQIEIGYWFATAARGRGMASEAVSAVVHRIRESYPDRRLYAECLADNRPSWALLERVGFHPTDTPGDRPGRMRLVYASARVTDSVGPSIAT
ncbi:GNAT family N-acetyltransferase [Fodinicurvata sp. EGI_FJ10296]|uniref:GNAT family N-acetyltransferase n=1 Tax=Fodinicurvata sp. EGI_FJ10296 TaxID=3231908 RepID=UPI0034523DA9